jgi:signal transduction histidine kinase/DNA-binding response OmpR family regulator
MEGTVTPSMLADLFACSALVTLAIYHLMIYWGRRKDREEGYNLLFVIFVVSATLFIAAPYFQPQFVLYSLKPSWLYVINMEVLFTWMLFYSGIRFLNLLLKFPASFKRYFYFTFAALPFCFLLTLTANIFGTGFYFQHVMHFVLIIVALNVIIVYSIYGFWIYKERLFSDTFVRLFYFGFILLTANILIYRTIELFRIPEILVYNHYVSALILFIFAYALSVKFNREHNELKELKIELERKVDDRTEELRKSYRTLVQTNSELDEQRLEILFINDQLLLQADELKELDKVKSRFFTNISHEFRTPLTLIIGPLETLLPYAPDENVKSTYQMMLRQARRLLTLINQLLELSKAEQGMLKLNLFHDNFSNFVQALTESFAPLAHDLNIQLTFKAEVSTQYLFFDKDKVEKIFSNLITNALKFTGRGGRVDVLLRSSDKFVEVAVRDSGVGLSDDQLRLVFEPFYQTESIQAGNIEGTGIGLSLVKELVDLHEGHITVSSLKGEGSEFTVCLPVGLTSTVSETAISVFPSTRPDIEVNAEADLVKIKDKAIILVVEDNEDMRYYVRSHLPDDYQMIEAVNGVEGMEVARETIPDLIIADIMMPLMNGLEMTRNIKQDVCLSHIPVIILTAKATDANKLEGLETTADDYVTKPFNMAELCMRIKNLIASRQMLREKFSKNITVTPSELVTTTLDEKFLQKALALVEVNMSESDFSAVDFCEGINMSRAQVHRKLKALTDQSVTEFIRCIRLKRAAQLLKQNTASVSEIAYQTGFNNLSYFSRCFKDEYHVLPSAYAHQAS